MTSIIKPYRLADKSAHHDQKCQDFDEDCADVPCHISCWLGQRIVIGHEVFETPPAKGYCPYLRSPKADK